METMARGTAKLTLPADDQIMVTREFAAPPHLVYRVWTEPELVSRWWHAEHGDMTCCEIDLRVGGRWRYAMNAKSGFEVAFHGEYREIEPGRRLVTTEVYEGAPDSPGLTSATFEECEGGTRLTLLMKYRNRADRDLVIESGMESGLQVALDLAGELAASLE